MLSLIRKHAKTRQNVASAYVQTVISSFIAEEKTKSNGKTKAGKVSCAGHVGVNLGANLEDRRRENTVEFCSEQERVDNLFLRATLPYKMSSSGKPITGVFGAGLETDRRATLEQRRTCAKQNTGIHIFWLRTTLLARQNCAPSRSGVQKSMFSSS